MFSLSQLRKLLAALVLAFAAVLMLPACSSTDEGTTTSGTSETQETSDCDQALTSEERRKCLEMLSN